MNTEQTPKRSLVVSLLLRLLIILIIVFLLIWFFPTRKSLNPLYQDVFRTNINSMKEAAEKYYTNERLPKNVNETVKMTLKEMLDKHLLLPFVDKNGNYCSLENSYVEITRKETEFELKVNLSCDEETAYIIEHLGCDDKCLLLGDCSSSYKDITEYEFKRQTVNKVLTSSKCATGYTKKGNLCVRNVTKTKTVAAKAIYENNTETASKIPVYKDEEVVTKAKPTYETVTLTRNEVKVYDYKYAKEQTYYEEEVDKTKPIYHTTYDNLLTYKTIKTCSGYTYFIDTKTNGVYQVTGKQSWSSYETTMHEIPSDTPTTKYEVLGMSYEECKASCALNPVYRVRVSKLTNYKYINDVNSVTSVTAKCNVTEQKVPVYGQKSTFVGYQTNRVEKTRWDVKWSDTKTDKTLLNNGYVYTNIRKLKETKVNETYSCDASDYKYNSTTKKCEKQVQQVKNYTCSANETLKGTDCYKKVSKLTGYKCNAGFTLDEQNNMCVKKNSKVVGYKCDQGTLKDKKCVITYTAEETKKPTNTYKNVYGVEYTWSSKKTLSGWTATGKTRTKTTK